MTDLVMLKLPAVKVRASIPITIDTQGVASDFRTRSPVSPAYSFAGLQFEHQRAAEPVLGRACRPRVPVPERRSNAPMAHSERVTIIDPIWGRRELLWSVLGEVASRLQ